MRTSKLLSKYGKFRNTPCDCRQNLVKLGCAHQCQYFKHLAVEGLTRAFEIELVLKLQISTSLPELTFSVADGCHITGSAILACDKTRKTKYRNDSSKIRSILAVCVECSHGSGLRTLLYFKSRAHSLLVILELQTSRIGCRAPDQGFPHGRLKNEIAAY